MPAKPAPRPVYDNSVMSAQSAVSNRTVTKSNISNEEYKLRMKQKTGGGFFKGSRDI